MRFRSTRSGRSRSTTTRSAISKSSRRSPGIPTWRTAQSPICTRRSACAANWRRTTRISWPACPIARSTAGLKNLPGFRENIVAYSEAMEALGKRLLPILARALDLKPDFFDEALKAVGEHAAELLSASAAFRRTGSSDWRRTLTAASSPCCAKPRFPGWKSAPPTAAGWLRRSCRGTSWSTPATFCGTGPTTSFCPRRIASPTCRATSGCRFHFSTSPTSTPGSNASPPVKARSGRRNIPLHRA